MNSSEREIQEKLASMSIFEQYAYLTKLIVEQRELSKMREYRSHFTILTLDMTQTDSYGIPKLTMTGKGRTLAYPHKVRVNFKTEKYLVQIGGFDVRKVTRSMW